MNAYEIITERIISLVEKNQQLPWECPWARSKLTDPMNAATKTGYHGVNHFLLSLISFDLGYRRNLWLTFNQAKSLGGSIRKGEHGTPVLFFTSFEKEDEEAEDGVKRCFCARYYTVFNVAQCDGLDETKFPAEEAKVIPQGAESLVAGEKLIADYLAREPVTLEHDGGNRAFYRPSNDSIHLPERRSYLSTEGYYSTAFHEIGHSTGHGTRLARKGIKTEGAVAAFGSSDYGQEELVAEFCAAFLCGTVGVERPEIENHAAYVANWLKAIKSNPRALVFGASQGEKAARFVLSGEKPSK